MGNPHIKDIKEKEFKEKDIKDFKEKDKDFKEIKDKDKDKDKDKELKEKEKEKDKEKEKEKEKDKEKEKEHKDIKDKDKDIKDFKEKEFKEFKEKELKDFKDKEIKELEFPGQTGGGDPNPTASAAGSVDVAELLRRVERLERHVGVGGPFISQDERPAVGERALTASEGEPPTDKSK